MLACETGSRLITKRTASCTGFGISFEYASAARSAWNGS
jgi:hypothetical protein